ncbi:dihydrolipoyl dehydrogenase [Halomonas shantousis]
MEEREAEVAIIGAGSAGLAAYRAAKARTRSVMLIEGGSYGTTCARTGCMPSKLLIAAANAIHDARHVEVFGGRLGAGVSVDGRAVMARVHHERASFLNSVLSSVEQLPAEDKLQGPARFENSRSLLVGDHTRVRFERVVIACGSRPKVPDIFKAAGDRLVTSDTLFEWETLPESVAVFGPGVTGLELGQALARLNVRLRVFGRSGGLGGLTDPVVRDEACRVFNREFPLDPQVDVQDISRQGERIVITFRERGSGDVLREAFDYLLVATGRQSNLDRLGLENTCLDLDDKGVPAYDRFTMQCQGEGDAECFFIAGDADQGEPLLHEATDEGRIAGDNAGRFPHIRAGHRRVPLSVVFCEPQIARAGLGHAEVQQRYGDRGGFACAEISFEDQGRARVMNVNRGRMRVYGEYGSGLLLGAEILGPDAEHLGHLLAWACQQRMTVTQILRMPFYHPTLEEGLRTVLRDLGSRLRLESALVDPCMECGPGT